MTLTPDFFDHAQSSCPDRTPFSDGLAWLLDEHDLMASRPQLLDALIRTVGRAATLGPHEESRLVPDPWPPREVRPVASFDRHGEVVRAAREATLTAIHADFFSTSCVLSEIGACRTVRASWEARLLW